MSERAAPDRAAPNHVPHILLFTAALAAVALLHFLTRVPGTLLFWLAFVLTRPFGATFGDFLTKPTSHGGLDLGTIGSSAFFAVVLAAAIAWETRLERARRDPAPALA